MARGGVDVGEDAAKTVFLRLTDRKFRDAKCAYTAYVGARRPYTALLGQRVRRWNARNVIARLITAYSDGASPNFTMRRGVDVGEDAAKIVCSGVSGGYDKTGSSERQNAPTPPMSAPGGLARRFWGDASVYHMSVTSLREHSTAHIMARHRTLRREMASASAKMPRTCISVAVGVAVRV
jgi:hypothetical protein